MVIDDNWTRFYELLRNNLGHNSLRDFKTHKLQQLINEEGYKHSGIHCTIPESRNMQMIFPRCISREKQTRILRVDTISLPSYLHHNHHLSAAVCEYEQKMQLVNI